MPENRKLCYDNTNCRGKIHICTYVIAQAWHTAVLYTIIGTYVNT